MSSDDFKGFPPETFKFLKNLARHNVRDWFKENEHRYEKELVAPCFSFIRAMAPRIAEISPHYVAEAKKVRGSLMRIHRDIRFSTDKTPYNTHIGISFYHEKQKTTAAPGFYVHLDPKGSFLGLGVWHPDAVALKRIRSRIVAEPKRWIQARDDRNFRRFFELQGASLVKPPQGYPKDHPLIEDLKRKDFIGGRTIDADQIGNRNFVNNVGRWFKASAPFMHFLCDAMAVPF